MLLFVPLEPASASDVSDDCSEDDGPETGPSDWRMSDVCPEPPRDGSNPSESPSDPSACNKGPCRESTKAGGEQSSETSDTPSARCGELPFAERGRGTEKQTSYAESKRRTSTEQVSDITGVKVVATVDALNVLAADVAEHGGPVALDTETTGLDPERDRVRLVQVAFGGGAYVVDTFAFQYPATALKPLFESLAGVEVVGHNLQFDLQFLARLGFVPGVAFDTMVASQLLHAGDREADTNARMRHGLVDVLERELGIAVDKAQQKSDWSRPTLTAAQLEYAAADVRHLLPLAAALREKLAAARLADTAACELKALLGIAWAAPIAVDAIAWTALADSAERDLVHIAEEMDRLAPNPNCLPGTESRNWNSPAEVLAALAQVGVKANATDDDTLASLTHPLADRLRDYRAAGKRAGTYGKKWLAEHAARGAVRPHWNQLGASSGRMSCSGPNLQQIPRTGEYRRCFVARPGCVLVKADYSQIELRVAAVVAGEDAMIRAYAEGRDLHALTASALLGKPIEEVAKGDRQLAKAINFGLLFGMGWKSLGQYAAANYGVTLTDAEAQRYRDAFFRTYPKLLAWHRRVEERLKTQIRRDPEAVLVESTRGGRRCSLPAARRNAAGKPFPNKSEFLNFPVQGTAADGMKSAIGLLWERRRECPGAVPVLFVHDEIVIECPESAAESAKAWLSRCMVDGMAPLVSPVPVEVEATVGTTWGG